MLRPPDGDQSADKDQLRVGQQRLDSVLQQLLCLSMANSSTFRASARRCGKRARLALLQIGTLDPVRFLRVVSNELQTPHQHSARLPLPREQQQQQHNVERPISRSRSSSGDGSAARSRRRLRMSLESSSPRFRRRRSLLSKSEAPPLPAQPTMDSVAQAAAASQVRVASQHSPGKSGRSNARARFAE